MRFSQFYNVFFKGVALIATLCIVSCHNEQSITTTQQKKESWEYTLNGNGNPEKKQRILEGVQALRQRDYEGASLIFNELLTQDPANSGLHTLNALTYQLKAKNGEFSAYDLAEAGYQQAKKFNPENTFASLQLGRVKAEKKDYIGAQEEFADVLLFDPSHEEAFYELASASYLAGDIRTAQMCIDMVLKKNAKRPEYIRAGALIYAVQGNKKKAWDLVASYKTVEHQPKRKDYLEKRVNEWLGLHDSGNVALIKTAALTPPPAAIGEALGSSGTNPEISIEAGDDAPPPPWSSTPAPSYKY